MLCSASCCGAAAALSCSAPVRSAASSPPVDNADRPLSLQRADPASFVDKLTSLGASHAKSFSASVTHLLHAGTKQNETFGDFKKARAAKLPIVHPEWLEKVSPVFPRRPPAATNLSSLHSATLSATF